MAFLGSVTAFNSLTLASGTNIPSSAGNPLELEDNTLQDISSMDFSNSTAGNVGIYLGADTDLRLVCIIPFIASGIVTLQRQPVMIPKGSRISARNMAAAALNSGSLILNGWV